jgi:hypothetical protein
MDVITKYMTAPEGTDEGKVHIAELSRRIIPYETGFNIRNTIEGIEVTKLCAIVGRLFNS